jgi:hypothetical protein
MLQAIGEFLPMSIGLALSPIPVAAVIGILLSGRPANALPFLIGWILGILSVGFVVFAIPGLDTDSGEPTELSGWIRVALGVGFLIFAAYKWKRRPKTDAPAEPPKALSMLDSYGPGKTAITAFLFSALNPKGFVLTFTAAAAIHYSIATLSGRSIALVIYTIIASLNVLIPVIGYSLFSEKIRPALLDWKDWLIRNNAALMEFLLIVFGALIIGNGLRVLSAY